MRDVGRPIYVLQIRAEPGIDGIRALRAFLKIMLRQFGLRCLSIEKSGPHGDHAQKERESHDCSEVFGEVSNHLHSPFQSDGIKISDKS